jgi:hypothetical protein
MLSRFVAILLILTVISSNLTKCIIFASFKINQRYIAKELCENRDKPELNCEGKCYLAKKLKQAEEKEQQQERQAQKNLLQEAFIGKVEPVKFHTSLIAVLDQAPADIYFFQQSLSVFHPPRV